MLSINFVPDDYVQSNESRRTNWMCLILFAIVMAGLGGSFVTIKIRQRACAAKEALVNARMTQIQESIRQFEELQTKRKAMMKAALTTAELLEPVPRSVLLASFTNNLPPGVSLLKLTLIQKEPVQSSQSAGGGPTNKYQAAQAEKAAAAAAQQKLPREKSLETHIDISGMAPSDLQVATYIEQLTSSSLLDDVELVESKEYKVEDTIFRQFKLTAKLRPDVQLTKEDISRIKTRAEKSVYNF
ncbi:MAG: PilN domain-containing protein [Planctomycetota bacterium]|nr:PilN domain-containing protein [Planctomycetota bacterium]